MRVLVLLMVMLAVLVPSSCAYNVHRVLQAEDDLYLNFDTDGVPADSDAYIYFGTSSGNTAESLKWDTSSGWFEFSDDLNVTGALTFGSLANLTITGNLTVNGDTVLGDASDDTTTIGGNIDANGTAHTFGSDGSVLLLDGGKIRSGPLTGSPLYLDGGTTAAVRLGYKSSGGTQFGDGSDGAAGSITAAGVLTIDNTILMGDGGAGADYYINVDGETNDGRITFMEDEDRWDFTESILALSFSSDVDSALNLTGDTDVIVELDEDNDGTEQFEIQDGADATIFKIAEAGTVTIYGTMSPDSDANQNLGAPGLTWGDIHTGQVTTDQIGPTADTDLLGLTADTLTVTGTSSVFGSAGSITIADGAKISASEGASDDLWLDGVGTGGIRLGRFGSGGLYFYGGTSTLIGSLSSAGALQMDSNLTIGSAAAGVDYTLTFHGENSSLELKWDEDNSRLVCPDQFYFSGTGAGTSGWRTAHWQVYQAAGGEIEFHDGSQVEFEFFNTGQFKSGYITAADATTSTFGGTVEAANGFKDGANAGIDDTFVNGDGDTVTVSGGIITSIVAP